MLKQCSKLRRSACFVSIHYKRICLMEVVFGKSHLNIQSYKQIHLILCVAAAVKSVVMSSGDNHHSTFVNPTVHQTFYLVENRPSQLHCISLGGFPPPQLQMLVDGRRDLTSEMSSSDRTELTGSVGMRLILHRKELFTYNFVPTVEDEGRTLSCVSSVTGLRQQQHEL